MTQPKPGTRTTEAYLAGGSIVALAGGLTTALAEGMEAAAVGCAVGLAFVGAVYVYCRTSAKGGK